MNSMHIVKNRRFFITAIVGIVTVVAMAWYVNTYIYKFLAAFPKVNVEVKPYALKTSSTATPQAITSIAPGKEFDVRVTIANQNIDGVDLYLTYDKSKVEYFNDYAQTVVPGGGYTQFPDQYFTSPIIEEVTTIGDKKQIRLVLMSVTTERKNLVQLNFRFRSLANATLQSEALFTLESKSIIVGVDGSNNVGEFEKEPVTALGKVTIQGTASTITPSVSPTISSGISPSVSPTPPWVNPSTNSTTVWGIVQTVDANGVVVTPGYVRKDSTVCPSSTFINSPTTSVNGIPLDKCYNTGSADIPYFSTEISYPVRKDNEPTSIVIQNITYELRNIPEGYECVGYERLFRKKSDGSTVVDARGTGCIATSLKIDIQLPSSQFENSHLLRFTIKKKANISGIPVTTTIVPSGSITPSVTITPPVGKAVDANVTMKLRFQGITNPKPENNKMLVEVGLWSTPSSTQKVEFTYQDNGIWVGTFNLKNVLSGGDFGPYYSFFVKGPKHIRKKICDTNPTEAIPGTYNCHYGNLKLKEGANEFDFSNILLLGGDLPIQDGVVNSLDFAFIRQNFGSTDPEVLLRGDLNLDGIIQTDDHTLIKNALEFKYDEE